MNTLEHINEPHAKWEKVELSSCFELQNGINFSSEQRGKGLLVLDVLNMFSDSLYVRTDKLYRVDINVAEDRLLRPGDILFVRSSVKESGVGWPSIFKGHDEPVTNCGFLIRARQTSPKIEPRFLVHYLRQGTVRAQMISRAGKVAITNINQERLGSLKIPLPPLEEQKRIADILDRAEALRAKRRASLDQLTELVKSIFIEMFGDPAFNPKGWPICNIGNLLESASYGTSEKSEATGEYPVLRMNNITRTGEMDFSDLKFMDLVDSQKERYLVQTGDVLFNRTNSADLVGKTAVFRDTKPMAYAGYLIRLRVNSQSDPEYLSAFLNTDYSKRMLRGMCKSIIGMANINAKEVQAIKIPQPTLALQKEFARRLTAIEKLKVVYKASLAEMDELFASLQYRAFRGEL